MLKSWLIAVGGMTLILALWAGVQIAWRKFFPEITHDSDVLAARGCGSGTCSCFGTVCTKPDKGQSHSS